MSSEVDTKGRVALAGMFGGEQVTLSGDLSGVFQSEDSKTLEQDISELPNEIVLYLHSLAPHLPEFVSELISELLESLKEKEARRRLWERFGIPQSVLAVPVFKQLSENLGKAQGDVAEKSRNLQNLAQKLTETIRMVTLFYAERLNRLEEEERNNDKAINELRTTNANGATMQKTVSESAFFFEKQGIMLEEEKSEAETAWNVWQVRVKAWAKKLPLLKSLETPVDLGLPDPAMAL